jgi:hypothetical protein
MRRIAGLAGLILALGVAVAATEIPEAELILEVHPPAVPGRVHEAAPPRFVLLKGRKVYIGGESRILTARLEKRDVKPIEKLVKRVRKIKGLGASVTLGAGETRYVLSLRKGRRLDVTARGDPTRAPGALRPLGELLTELSSFYHPALRPYRPAQYALGVREARLVGGCRSWDLGVPLQLGPPVRTVPAREAVGWPTGSHPASVCRDDRHFVVTLRPLLPGEAPPAP